MHIEIYGRSLRVRVSCNVGLGLAFGLVLRLGLAVADPRGARLFHPMISQTRRAPAPYFTVFSQSLAHA